jgi:pimeloyl-ACP methyl ester carboxylesterase
MDVEGRYLDIDGATAFVESRGEGPSVLCVHTAGQSGRQWQEVLAELPELGWRVHAPDLPGHGRSDLLPSGPVESIEQYATWCASLLAALGIERSFVVGCSIGGKVALELAASSPDRVPGVVAMAADARNTVLSPGALRRSLEDSVSPSRGDRTYLGTLAVVGASVPPDRAAAIARRHQCEDPIVSITDLVAWATHDVTDRAADIRVPVVLAYGTDDFWVLGDDIQALAATIPTCRCHELRGVGHYPMEEIPGFAAQLHEWLQWLGTALPD